MIKRREKITAKIAWEIKYGSLSKERPVDLAKDLGICRDLIRRIRRGERWAHVTKESVGERLQLRGSRVPRSKLTELQVMNMLGELLCGMSQSDCASRYGVSLSTVHRIDNGETWKHVPRPKGMEAVR